MAGTGPEDLHALAVELLDASIESLDTIPTFAPALGGAPERSFVSPGIPVWDCCEQLTVHVTNVLDADTSPGGLASGRRNVHGKLNHVGFNITVTRCVPTFGATPMDELPLIEDMQAAAEQINADGWALWNHLYNMWREGSLFDTCQEVFFDGITAVAPSGGCGGWLMAIRVQLDGYEES